MSTTTSKDRYSLEGTVPLPSYKNVEALIGNEWVRLDTAKCYTTVTWGDAWFLYSVGGYFYMTSKLPDLRVDVVKVSA